MNLSVQIVRLMHVDLIRQAPLWKDEMRRMRDIVFNLETKGYQNVDAFKLHWDYQLYKVLEHQYVSGLQDMASKLPDIHVDLVFRCVSRLRDLLRNIFCDEENTHIFLFAVETVDNKSFSFVRHSKNCDISTLNICESISNSRVALFAVSPSRASLFSVK